MIVVISNSNVYIYRDMYIYINICINISIRLRLRFRVVLMCFGEGGRHTPNRTHVCKFRVDPKLAKPTK